MSDQEDIVNNDIVDRLRERGSATEDEAADLIERLTTERDEARREVCEWEHRYDKTASEYYYASQRGWDCFKEDGK